MVSEDKPYVLLYLRDAAPIRLMMQFEDVELGLINSAMGEFKDAIKDDGGIVYGYNPVGEMMFVPTRSVVFLECKNFPKGWEHAEPVEVEPPARFIRGRR